MNKILKYFTILALSVVTLMSFSYKVNASETTISSRSSFQTLNDIENVLLDYFKENNLNYTLGSNEYIDYLSGILLEDKDVILANHPKYEDILFYATEYVVAGETVTLGSSNERTITDPIRSFRYKDIAEIKKENILQDEISESYSKNFQLQIYPKTAYSGTAAASYAIKWANSRNPLYDNYSKNCTNFVSQAVHAGGMNMYKDNSQLSNPGIHPSTTYWYSNIKQTSNAMLFSVSGSWARVIEFHDYWSRFKPVKTETKTGNIAYYGEVGDVVQFKRVSDSKWYHSTIITKKANGTVYLASNTSDYPQKDITTISSHPAYRLIRF